MGVTDESLLYKSTSSKPSTTTVNVGDGPITKLLDLLDTLGLKIDNALTSPAVRLFMQQAGIKMEELRAADEKRKQKKNLVLWGGAAVLVVTFLALRK